MKKFLFLLLFPSVCYADVIQPNNPNISEIVTVNGNGNSELNGTQTYCDGGNATFSYDGLVEINLSCNNNSVSILGNYQNLSDTTSVSISGIETDMSNDASGICNVSSEKIECYGKNKDIGYDFSFRIKGF